MKSKPPRPPLVSVPQPTDQVARQSGHPNLLKGGPTFVKGGPSPNPGGRSKYDVALEAAIQKQETPARVCEVIEAMHEDATAHEKYSASAAKVYLGAVGVRLNAEPAKVDLSDLPDNVVQLIAERIR